METDIGSLWLDNAIDYAIDVRDGNIPACRYVKLAVERWFRDLEFGHERGLYFDESKAIRYFRFIGKYCRHSEAEWGGQLLVYEPWQCFIEANVHGWMREDGTRRFRTVYEEVARKNGKTLRMAANGLYYLAGDKEPGPQVYSAATKKEQAREIFEGALAMVRQDETLLDNLIDGEHKISPVDGRGKFVPLSKDSKRMDGFNVHAGLIDELHAHPDHKLFNVIRSGTAARLQAIMRIITTAGFDRKSFCYSVQRQFAIKVLEGIVKNDSLFAIIYTLDKPEDWGKPEEWIKANPNLGVSVKESVLEEQLLEAKENPEQKVEFLTKRLNIWTYGSVAWMNMEKWKECINSSINPTAPFNKVLLDKKLDGAECYAALDLSAQEDLSSLSLTFPFDDMRLVFHRSYITEAALERRARDGDETLRQFVDSGELIVIPGDYIDQSVIEEDILLIFERFDLKGVAFDRWNSSQLVKNMIEEGVPMVEFGQGMASMSAPMKEVMRLTLTSKITHNDGVLTWAMSNVVATKDAAGNIKPDKSKVSEKIDPAVATIMAIALAMKPEEDDGSGALDEFLENPITL